MRDGFKRAFRLDRPSGEDVRSSVDDELRHHLDLTIEELTGEGWPPAEAEREALRRFGDIDDTRAYCREMQARRGREERRREIMSFDEIHQDLRYALRSIRKGPGYAGLVILTLAFGIAANTTIFSVMNPYLFRPLPYGDADELVQVNVVNPSTGWDMDRLSWPQYLDWRERSRAFSGLAAYSYGAANVTDAEGPEQIQYARLTADMFAVLDVQPASGRTFRPEDGIPGAEPVVVLAHDLWQRRYLADPGTVGRAITLDGVPHTVVGIMPPEFNFPFGTAKMWVPIRVDLSSDRARNPYILVGRLAEGWTIDRARDELEGVLAELSAQYPDVDGRMSGVTVKPVREALNFVWDVMNALFYVLLGAVAFVLLIACANVASLTLARGSTRLREVSVRAALGARRGRIIRQLLTESLVLASLGGAGGVALAYGFTGLIDGVIPDDLFKVGAISIDGTVLAFSLVLTVLTPVLFGLVPALSASRVDLTGGLKEASKGSGGLATSRGRQILVVTQVALAVVLITGAGLMMRSFASVQRIDLGFDPDRVVTAELLLPADAYPSSGEVLAFLDEAVTAVARIPGVTSASTVRWLPLNHETTSDPVAPTELAGAPEEEWQLATANHVHTGYFETMGISLLSGRDFVTTDGAGSQLVVVVDRTLAERLWPTGNAVGRTLLIGGPDEGVATTVVGVVEPVHHMDLDPANVGPQYYRPALQATGRRFFVLGRTDADPASLVPAVRTALGAVAPELPLTIRPFDDVVAENAMQWSIGSVFLGIFGAGALLLATLGIYGLISFSVAQRGRELGVRIALGASASEIRRSVVGDGLKLTAVGVGIGLLLALGMGQLISAALYGVDGSDPVTLAAVLVLFVSIAALASFVPAARASTADPISVLRAE